MPFHSLQMPISIGHQKKVRTNSITLKPQKYIYHHCLMGHVTPGLGLLVSICIFLLPVLEVVDEHVQLTTMNISLWSCHMTFSHAILMLPSLNNVLPAMVLQNRVVWLTKCPSSKSSVHCVFHSPAPIITSCMRSSVVEVMLVLLLMLSGDIETNPGPVGEFLCQHDISSWITLIWCHILNLYRSAEC